jgi:hypothetical protein
LRFPTNSEYSSSTWKGSWAARKAVGEAAAEPSGVVETSAGERVTVVMAAEPVDVEMEMVPVEEIVAAVVEKAKEAVVVAAAADVAVVVAEAADVSVARVAVVESMADREGRAAEVVAKGAVEI